MSADKKIIEEKPGLLGKILKGDQPYSKADPVHIPEARTRANVRNNVQQVITQPDASPVLLPAPQDGSQPDAQASNAESAETAKQWHVIINGQQKGPMGLAEIELLRDTNTINRESIVWKDGMPEWRPIANTRETAHLFPSLPPTLPPAIPAQTVTPVQQAQPLTPQQAIVPGQQTMQQQVYPRQTVTVQQPVQQFVPQAQPQTMPVQPQPDPPLNQQPDPQLDTPSDPPLDTSKGYGCFVKEFNEKIGFSEYQNGLIVAMKILRHCPRRKDKKNHPLLEVMGIDREQIVKILQTIFGELNEKRFKRSPRLVESKNMRNFNNRGGFLAFLFRDILGRNDDSAPEIIEADLQAFYEACSKFDQAENDAFFRLIDMEKCRRLLGKIEKEQITKEKDMIKNAREILNIWEDGDATRMDFLTGVDLGENA